MDARLPRKTWPYNLRLILKNGANEWHEVPASSDDEAAIAAAHLIVERLKDVRVQDIKSIMLHLPDGDIDHQVQPTWTAIEIMLEHLVPAPPQA